MLTDEERYEKFRCRMIELSEKWMRKAKGMKELADQIALGGGSNLGKAEWVRTKAKCYNKCASDLIAAVGRGVHREI
jgi:hypothetical protein